LEASEARFHTLFEYAQVGVVLADAESVYLDANASACQMFGYSRAEFIGLHATDIVAPAEVQHVPSALAEILRDSDHEREWRFRRKDGSVFSADVLATKMPDGTLLAMIRDASDRQQAHEYREHLAAIVESSGDAIIGKDLEGIVTSWNAGAEANFGYAAAEMIGTSITRLIPPAQRDEEPAILAHLRRGQRVEHLETLRQTRDGRVIDVSVTVSPIRDPGGRVIGASKIVRDISALKEREREIARLSRLYAALGQINQAIVRAPTRDELFERECRVLVELGGFCMAWIAWHDVETDRLVPVAEHGDQNGYLKTINVFADARPEGCGPSGIAYRSGRPYICNDMPADPATLPWRAESERRGFNACAAFPIRRAGSVCGTLQVYSDKREFFHDKEITLLEEAGLELSFALDNFARDEARGKAEQAVRSEKSFSDTMIASMPGIVYIYDARGSFLRWNQNFETMSGYSSSEIARLHPLDFFSDADRPRVAQRIAEALAGAESSVEAALVAKDGTATPCFFTGRRVLFEGQACLIGVGIDISARRRAEGRLAESERKYRELVEHANSIILRWSAAGGITFLNEFGLSFFGYSAAEIVGRLVTDTIVPASESSGRDLGRLIADICATPEAFEQSVNENVRRNGERVWIAWTNRIVRDGKGEVLEILSIGTDITEVRRAEAALRASEANLVAAQRIARIGSWELDIPGDRLNWSAQVYELFGVRRSEFRVSFDAFLAFVHPLDRDRLQAAHFAARCGDADLDIEHRIVLDDGTEKVVHQLAALERDDSGRPLVLAGTIHDITDRVRLAVERDKRHRAEAADRIKSAFLATMSHELRTPLNSIVGFTGILLQGLAGPFNPEQGKQLDMVRTSARHLLALVNDVLDISKIEAGQLEVVRQPFDPARSVARVVALLTPLADAKGLALRVDVAPALGEAMSDERRFEQIVLNLVTNAIKFTDRGEVSLAADLVTDYCPAGASSAQPAIRLRVADTGTGIRPEHLPGLFQPFRQIDSGLSRQHEGTGLGLAICHRLAILLGGEIHAESEWEKGSVFSVTLPLDGPAS
jgi:PAS domain S-box-containing protein